MYFLINRKIRNSLYFSGVTLNVNNMKIRKYIYKKKKRKENREFAVSRFRIKHFTVRRRRLAGRRFADLYIILFRLASREVH